jgi:hypothetical protein
MNGIKAKIIDEALKLLELLNMCEDDTFVDEIANAVMYNDEKALEYMEEEL